MVYSLFLGGYFEFSAARISTLRRAWRRFDFIVTYNVRDFRAANGSAAA
jgi:hypothetical protein